ncbi:DUF6090 family protein [uncultured Winogradskyella sp.]|uniref:DUF6090 family protein n=1 Tax=uncultured Winogradskyella sp. TaxID=395353 RepID=UPI0026281FD6|nr:DUF6090 family protein [uncultured Winogradskyella sp.]
MIKFFRKIRQRLLSENKFSKYLIYAVGEIVLVVIGILIALQINNWNSDRIEYELESNMLSEILVNLEKDVFNLNSKINYNENRIKHNSAVLEHLILKTPLTDTLRFSYARLTGRGTFEPITVAYENLKSKGIDIIRNDSLRISISELYDFKYFYVTEDLRMDYEPIKDFHMSEIYKNVKTTYEAIDNRGLAEPVNLSNAQNDIYFQEALKRAISFYRWMNRNYRNGIRENEIVQMKIKVELTQNGK